MTKRTRASTGLCSIWGKYSRRWSLVAHGSRVAFHGSTGSPSRTICCAGGAEKRLEQSPVEGVPVEEKLRVPLDAEKEAVGRRFDGLHNTIRG